MFSEALIESSSAMYCTPGMWHTVTFVWQFLMYSSVVVGVWELLRTELRLTNIPYTSRTKLRYLPSGEGCRGRAPPVASLDEFRINLEHGALQPPYCSEVSLLLPAQHSVALSDIRNSYKRADSNIRTQRWCGCREKTAEQLYLVEPCKPTGCRFCSIRW